MSRDKNCSLCGAYKQCSSCRNLDCLVDDCSGIIRQNCFDNEYKNWICGFRHDCKIKDAWAIFKEKPQREFNLMNKEALKQGISGFIKGVLLYCNKCGEGFECTDRWLAGEHCPALDEYIDDVFFSNEGAYKNA